MFHARKRTRAAAVIGGVAMTLSFALVNPLPGFAEPDVDEVRTKVETLYQQASEASERYNQARVARTAAQKRLRSLRADLARQQERVDGLRDSVASSLVRDYQGQALSTTSRMVLSEDPDEFLEELSAVSTFNDQRGQMMAELTVQLRRLEVRRKATEDELASLAKLEKTLAAEKADVDEKAAEAEDLLETLEARAAAVVAAPASRSAERSPVTIKDVPVSGRAKAAVQFALAQVGKSYVYGAAGPNSYDCSGLTMSAWAAAGVALPHSSSAQMGATTPISISQLQPGDLVFYYSPVSHVGIYIGNGQIVDAANPSTGVRIAGVSSMPISGAGRPG